MRVVILSGAAKAAQSKDLMLCYSSAYTPSVTLRVPAPSGREPFGVRMRPLQAPVQAPSLRGLAGRQARLREYIRDAEL